MVTESVADYSILAFRLCSRCVFWLSHTIPALRTWTTPGDSPHLCHRLLLCCSIIVSDIPGRNGWDRYCFRYTGSQWLGPMSWSTVGHLPSPHVSQSHLSHLFPSILIPQRGDTLAVQSLTYHVFGAKSVGSCRSQPLIVPCKKLWQQ